MAMKFGFVWRKKVSMRWKIQDVGSGSCWFCPWTTWGVRCWCYSWASYRWVLTKHLHLSCVAAGAFHNMNCGNIFSIELFLCPYLLENNYWVTMIFMGRSWIKGVIKELLLKRAVLMLHQSWLHHQHETCLFIMLVKQVLHKVGALSMFGLYFAARFPDIFIV